MRSIKEILEGLMSDDISGLTAPQPLDIKDINLKLNKESQEDINRAITEFNKKIKNELSEDIEKTYRKFKTTIDILNALTKART